MAGVVACQHSSTGVPGIASGIGSTRYGAQIVVEAASREEAVQRGRADFAAAAVAAGLPAWPVVRADAVSEAEDAEGDPG